MVELVRSYAQNIPALRFIGKKYGDSDRVDGMFGARWGDWFQNGWFTVVERVYGGSMKDIYEDGDAHIGLMRHKDGEPFEYWIGVFMQEGATVPAGFSHVDFPASRLGVCWLYGKESEIYCNEPLCYEKLKEQGLRVINDPAGACWFFERYGCPRFTMPDEQGNIILDICFFIE